ncbi:MAG: DUF2203 domain-containing protein [Nitrosopumilaceae archaeon]|nr:DUF2203 domain-containing protein [Nitrosopumilaceae archaeon]
MFRYFTISEANEALPDVAQKFREVVERRVAIKGIERRLQEALASGERQNNSDGGNVQAYMEIKQELNAAVTKLYRSIEVLEATGVSLKGLDEGLVDFPSKRFDEDVWLCWKAGETEIKFWHDTDSGFMGRKPIEVSDESLV